MSLKKKNVALFELNFSELMVMEKREKGYEKIPRFPSVCFDVSVVIDKNIEVEKIAKAIKGVDNILIKEVKLFDLYEGENIGKDKKAAAYQIILQSEERTLTSEEMAEIQGKIFGSLEKMGGIIRGS